MMARLLFVAAALFMAGCGGGAGILPEPFTRERADGKIPVKTELIRQQVQRELGGMPEGEAEVARWQAIETDYHACRLIADKAKEDEEKVFADCMAQRGYVYMYPIDAEQLHNDIEFEITRERDQRIAAERKVEEERIAAEKKRREEQERARRQKALDNALIAAVRNGDAKEEARLIAEGANPQLAENVRKSIAAERKAEEKRIATARKAEEERIAAEKKRQEEQERARQQKELNDALVIALNAKKYAKITEVKRLVDDGADVNTKGKSGWTPLHLAAVDGETKIAVAFMKLGAYTGAKKDNGATPLHLAALNGHAETFFAFIKAGADIDATAKNGWTALHQVAGGGHPRMIFILIKAGANIEAKDNNGFTPLHFAAGLGKTETVDILIKEGANIFARSNNGETPLDVAIQQQGKNSKVVRIMRREIKTRGIKLE